MPFVFFEGRLVPITRSIDSCVYVLDPSRATVRFQPGSVWTQDDNEVSDVGKIQTVRADIGLQYKPECILPPPHLLYSVAGVRNLTDGARTTSTLPPSTRPNNMRCSSEFTSIHTEFGNCVTSSLPGLWNQTGRRRTAERRKRDQSLQLSRMDIYRRRLSREGERNHARSKAPQTNPWISCTTVPCSWITVKCIVRSSIGSKYRYSRRLRLSNGDD